MVLAVFLLAGCMADDGVAFDADTTPDACDPVIPCEYLADSCAVCGNDTIDYACFEERIDFALGCGQCLKFTCHWAVATTIEFCSDPC